MKNGDTAASAQTGSDTEKNPFMAPSVSLPKGGGAIKGMGEKFGANPVNGSGTLTVPIYTTPGRAGFNPKLALSYDSGAGNGPFGFGWRLFVPFVTRKTDKGLPCYCDAQNAKEPDVFILSEADDLVPALVLAPGPAGQWNKDTFPATVNSQTYTVQRYRPRIEGLFARIERWVNNSTGDTFWKSVSKDNITSLYGVDLASRIADPEDPSRVFTWLLASTYDDRGNVASYEYKPEDSANVVAVPQEQNRRVRANRYLKRIYYGNRTPYYPAIATGLPSDWCFEVVFDYGEHDQSTPASTGSKLWRCRPDAFSSYRSCFEVRTYRLCSRVLMFHHFPQELGTQDYLVRSTDLAYSIDEQTPNPLNPIYAFLESITQTGYLKTAAGTGYGSKSLPPLEFSYTQAEVDETVHFPDPDDLNNLPYGADSARYQWVDLDSEGSPGILTEQADAWFYKRNVSNLPDADGNVTARFEPMTLVAPKPSLADLSGGGQQLMDLAGDGRLSLVQFARPAPGFFERKQDGQWQQFQPFAVCPNIDWRNPNLKTIDLNGDGFADILITEDEVLTWYPSHSREGFGSAQTVRKPFDEDQGPALVFADGTQSIYVADMSGDGLADILRIRNGELCYWPNLGYGRFGAKITMGGSPVFDSPDQFDQKRLRLADIDGSGTADIIYLGRDKITLWFNQSGNSWSSPKHISQFPATDDLDSVNVVDLLGNGIACLVWSSPVPVDTPRPMRYIDLMGGQKPHLLIKVKNNLGAETRVHYVASTQFYLLDRRAGQPWVTRLSFPVHVVERVETYDWISRNRFVTRYAYHHGYYDGIEREFRGFGMVEQQDTEELGALDQTGTFPNAVNIDAASYVPPVLTKTWFHTGAYPMGNRVSRVYEEEYYRESDLAAGVAGLTEAEFDAMLLPDTVLPPDLTSNEIHEAIRSLKGAILRQEIYGLDGTGEADRPYSVSERNYTINRLQPFSGNRHAVFFTHARETIDFHYERKLYDINTRKLADPRVTHSMVLAVDDYGNELQSVAIAYGRRSPDPDSTLTTDDGANQSRIHVTSTESTYTNPILTNAYRAPLPAEACTYELIKVLPDSNQVDITNLFGFDEMVTKLGKASDLPYEDIYATGATANHPYRRLIEQVRSLYRKDDLTGALPLGTSESRAFSSQNFKLAFTPGLLALYQRNQQNLLTNPATMLRDKGGYVLSDDQKAAGLFPPSDPNGYWWIPSGRVFFSSGATDTPAQEQANAMAHFFLPRRFQDPFGNNAIVLHDANDLLILETEDALRNKITTGERDGNNNITNRNDYRLMQPTVVTDPNGNRAAVEFDTLGLVVRTAVMGKATENLGDSLTPIVSELAQSAIDQFFRNPRNPNDLQNPYITPALLGNATSRIVYDLDRLQRTAAAAPTDPTQWEPVFAASIVRETHVSDLTQQNPTSKLQVSVSYSDGFGRQIQKKIQAEPGPVVPKGVTVNPRWVGSGWTIFNNKGKPVRQYEPFFDDTHDFRFGVTVGVSPILFYDPLGRVVATLRPNQTWEKVVFDTWRQESWDANDTVLISDPSSDSDVGDYFQRIPTPDYFPTWYLQRNGGQLGAQEQDAAMKAATHAGTPTVAWLDTLSRPFLTMANNGPAGKYATRVELDIEGNQRSATDALGRKIMTYDYDMLGTKIHQNSVDAGERWMLNDVLGKPLLGWNSRGFQIRHACDELRRSTHLYVASGTNPEQLVERVIYGEAHPDSNPPAPAAPAPLTLNLRGKAYKQFDGAGVVTNNNYDFRGNPLNGARQLLKIKNYGDQVDWSSIEGLLAAVPLDLNSISAALAPLLESDTFTTSTTYDALSRVVTLAAPDASVIRPSYGEANLVQQVNVNLQGAATSTAFVTDVKYNAKGQRESMAYGNGATTEYEYDPPTFRLTHLKTTRSSNNAALQDLTYYYDPVGNITQILDAAQQPVYFSNQVVTPSNDYTYDPIYRLIVARGREHIGQVSQPQTTWDDSSRMNRPIPNPNDGPAMRNYGEAYQYDPVGNILALVHTAMNGNWTRTYKYDEPNTNPTTNRLTSTTVGTLEIPYGHDLHGNMTQMPHLAAVAWDFKDQLQMTQRQVVNNGPAPKTYYIYDTAGQRVRKINVTANGAPLNERIYLGGYEVYHEYDNNAGTTLERQTLHVMDDKQRIALVETKTLGKDGSPPQLIRYQFSNHLGSVSLELDNTAQIISYEEYYPYGSASYQAVRNQTETPKRYRYTSKERDEETGLTYHGARYYVPWLGRWMSCDPAGMIDGSNVYTYCNNNPVINRDLNGMQTVPRPCPNCHDPTSSSDRHLSLDMPPLTLDQVHIVQESEKRDAEKNARDEESLLGQIAKADVVAGNGNVCQSDCHALKGIKGVHGNPEQMNADALLATEAALAPLFVLGGAGAVAARGLVSGLVLPMIGGYVGDKVGYGSAKAMGASESVAGAFGFAGGLVGGGLGSSLELSPPRAGASPFGILPKNLQLNLQAIPTQSNVLRTLRAIGNDEALATAKLISRGEVQLEFLSHDPTGMGAGGLQPFGTNKLQITPLGLMGSNKELAGLVGHEAMHWTQGLTPGTYTLTHELEAYAWQERIRNVVTPEGEMNWMQQKYGELQLSPLYARTRRF